jgi:hypothetical protein
MGKLRDALTRLEREAADQLAARKSILEKRIDLVAALDAIHVALDHPKYSQAEALACIRRLTGSALEADQKSD